MQIDLRVLELLSSKICHDLISPVSAINNGVELIEDIGETVVDEAMKLIADSAAQSSRRLKLFRVAYGRAGSEESLPIKDMRAIAEQYFVGSKTNLEWSETLDLGALPERRGALKTLINVMILSEEILAYGGTITLYRLSEDDTLGCRLEVRGRAAQMAPANSEALDGTTPVEALTPRTIQAYITGQFARHFGVQIAAFVPAEESLDLVIKVSPPEYDNHQAL